MPTTTKPTKPETKRCTLALPPKVYEELETMAMQREGGSVQELVRAFIRLGLLVMRENGTEQGTLVLRQGEREREIFLL